MIDFVFTVLCIVVAICVFVLVGTMCMFGTLMMFGAFFFEVVGSQITLALIGKHVLLFFGGAFTVATGLGIGSFALNKVMS